MGIAPTAPGGARPQDGFGKLDRLALARRRGGQIVGKDHMATWTMIRTMLDQPVERLAHGVGLALMAGLGVKGSGLVP